MKQRSRVLFFSGVVCLLFQGATFLVFSSFAFAREIHHQSPPLRSSKQEGASFTVGAFNLLHLGYGTHKNYPRVAQLIVAHNFDVFAGVEVMKPEAAASLLQALRKASGGADWALILSAAPTGERTYKEYLAFYYRADRVQPLETEGQYCNREDLHGLDASPQSCFARDEHVAGPDFERDPFVGHFSVDGYPLTLVAVHLVYGNQTTPSIEKRRQETLALHREMDRMRVATPAAEIVALGDFNLQLDVEAEMQAATLAPTTLGLPTALFLKAHPLFPSELFHGEHALAGLVTGPTTVGFSSYDHLLVYQDHLSHWTEATTVEDIDVSDQEALALYKQEVSDHFPVQAVLTLPR